MIVSLALINLTTDLTGGGCILVLCLCFRSPSCYLLTHHNFLPFWCNDDETASATIIVLGTINLRKCTQLLIAFLSGTNIWAQATPHQMRTAYSLYCKTSSSFALRHSAKIMYNYVILRSAKDNITSSSNAALHTFKRQFWSEKNDLHVQKHTQP